MPELTALMRVSLARHRWLSLTMLATVALGVSIALVGSHWAPGNTGAQVAIVALSLSLLPAGIASIVLFDYGLDQDLSQPDSGCSHWILRMPIRSWKIAIVPITLKSFWVSSLWIVLAVSVKQMGGELPLITPCIAFSAITVWILVMSWRPFGSWLTRLVAMLIAIPIFYGILVGAVGSPSIERAEWRSLAIASSMVVGAAAYLGGIWCLVRSTELARVNPGGMIPVDESRWRRTLKGSASSAASSAWDVERDDTCPIRQYRNPTHALFHHDFQMAYPWIWKIYLIFVIPTIVVFPLLIPMNSGSVAILLVLFIEWSACAMSRAFATNNASSVLPVYLAGSPLTTKTLAWNRQLFPLCAAVATYLCLIPVIVGWACWESNRENWMRWAQDQAVGLPGNPDPLHIGIRLSIAIVLGTFIFFFGRLASYAWAGMTGRTWVVMAATISAVIGYMALIGLALTWFMQQTDWESTRESALHFLSLLPWLIGSLLVAKLALALVIGLQTVRSRLASVTDLTRVSLGWLGLVAVLAITFYMLLPYLFATLSWCFALLALMVPLARILLLPLAVASNRHR